MESNVDHFGRPNFSKPEALEKRVLPRGGGNGKNTFLSNLAMAIFHSSCPV